MLDGMTRLVLCLSLLACAVSVSAAEEIPASAYARVNDALVKQHILPRYDRLADVAGAFADEVARSCGDPESGEEQTALRDRYQDLMDAWMGVEHMRFGPVELFMRSYRLYFWPEGRGKVAKALKELRSGSEADTLTTEDIKGASVAAQGLPAVEHLLYDYTGDAAGYCALLDVIARNMRDMAGAIAADWRGGEINFMRSFLNPGPDNVYYDSHADATLELFKSLHGGLQRIVDIKLKPVVGDSLNSARPQLAESRASRRSLRNIIVNLEALQNLYLGDDGPGLGSLVAAHGGDPELDSLMRRAFRMTLETTRGIDAPLSRAAVDESLRPQVEKLLTQVLALKQIVKSRVAPALRLAVGFNALDGD